MVFRASTNATSGRLTHNSADLSCKRDVQAQTVLGHLLPYQGGGLSSCTYQRAGEVAMVGLFFTTVLHFIEWAFHKWGNPNSWMVYNGHSYELG